MKRLLLGVAGALILALAGLFTLGTALAAPLGILAARWWTRSRGRVLTPFRSWLAAAVACGIAIGAAYTVAIVRSPDTTLQHFRETAARREAAPMPPPPTWVSRFFPQATTRPDPVTERIVKSRAFTLYFGIMGAVLAVAIFGALVGSLGWAGTVLLIRAFSRAPAG